MSTHVICALPICVHTCVYGCVYTHLCVNMHVQVHVCRSKVGLVDFQCLPLFIFSLIRDLINLFILIYLFETGSLYASLGVLELM